MVLKIMFLLVLIIPFFVTMDNAQINTNLGGVRVSLWLLLAKAVVYWRVTLGCLGVFKTSRT